MCVKPRLGRRLLFAGVAALSLGVAASPVEAQDLEAPGIDAYDPPRAADGKVSADCTLGGHKLYGKVQVVEHFPDLKVKVVQHFPDLKVKAVEHFPDKCGRLQFVEHFPDLKIQYVEHFPDLEIKMVDHFEGLP